MKLRNLFLVALIFLGSFHAAQAVRTLVVAGGLNASEQENNWLAVNTVLGTLINTGTAVTSTAAELNYLDLTTLGTGAASKAVVLDAGDDYTWPATGILTYGVLNDGTTQLNATAAELNQIADLSARFEDVTAANTLTAAECGKIMTLNSATEFASVLPAPSAGCMFKFIVKAAPAGASYTIDTNADANILIGGINELEVDTSDDGPYTNEADTITLVDGVAVVGDYVEMVSDGTSWYFHGQTNADGGVTFAQ